MSEVKSMKTLKKMALFVAAIFMTAMATVCVMAPNTVYASAAGNFVESPSQKDAPVPVWSDGFR